ncbi:hypothetical protein ACROYT_G007182 [Oculina patagonica]
MSSEHRMPDLIAKKRDGDELSEAEIHHFVKAATSNGASESQIGAMLMAMYLKGLNRDETVSLTKAMLSSGISLQWPEEWKGSIADKHSTGGVGDKVSLALAPALAVCGVKVPMISGRGLGHTGGTLDKLESIPGFQVNMDSKQMCDVLGKVGCCIVGQTEALVPADRVLYGIRDVTGTVASMPLITSSILSKKAAENLSALVMDVKFGKAAFATTEEKAQALAHTLVGTCFGLGIKAVALITSMDAPLGKAVGNSVEVAEAISCLNGKGPEDLKELVCGHLLYALNKVESEDAGKKLVAETLHNGKALQKFCDMLIAQGVQPGAAQKLCTAGADPYSILPLASQKHELLAEKSGIISGIDALVLAQVSHKLGAGRHNATDKIDHGVGFILSVRVGQFVNKGDKWVTVYHNGNLTDSQKALLEKALEIDENGGTADLPAVSRVIDVIDSKRRRSVFVCQ